MSSCSQENSSPLAAGPNPLFTKQIVIGESIYNTPLKSDFMLYHPQKHPDKLIIERKW